MSQSLFMNTFSPYSLQFQPRNNSKDSLVAFLSGLLGMLYVPIPGFGILAMLDIAAYVLALPLFLVWWPRMGRYSREAVGWGMLWTLAAIVANALTFTTMRYFWACVFVVASGWTLTLFMWVTLRKDAYLFLWFLIGYGVGATVGMYYFQNGAYLAFMLKAGVLGVEGLVEKQIYPNYAKTVVLAIGLFICLKAGSLFSLFSSILSITAGFWLLFNGGSRSNFGIFLAAGLLGGTVILFPRFIRWLFRHTAVILVIGLIGAITLFSVYANLAKSGRLGEGEYNKFEQEEEMNEEYDESRISARGGFKATWNVFKEKPWGEGGKLKRHSIISNSWNCEGAVGLLFWLYYFGMVMWFLKNRIPFSGKFATFLILLLFINCWDIMGSPFGARHKFFALLAFVALCKDNPQYGIQTVFDDQKHS